MPIEITVKCFLCATENYFMGIASTNMFGSPDLDSRPPEMKRSTMHWWVQRCTNCGYSATSLDQEHTGAKEIVNSREYQELLQNPSYPELARTFLAKSLLDAASDNLASGTWSLIHAAWVCDDSDHFVQATTCRKKAAEILMMCDDHGQKLFEQEGANTALLVDLLRRSGQADQARKVISEKRNSITEDIIHRILDFQTALLDRNDTSCHTIAEAVNV